MAHKKKGGHSGFTSVPAQATAHNSHLIHPAPGKGGAKMECPMDATGVSQQHAAKHQQHAGAGKPAMKYKAKMAPKKTKGAYV
jgi:hypothetical protein